MTVNFASLVSECSHNDLFGFDRAILHSSRLNQSFSIDFGMTLDMEPSLQYSLLEFVAHLTREDYTKIPEDLVKLGFLKADRLDTVRASGFLEPLAYMIKQAAGQGGGAD